MDLARFLLTMTLRSLLKALSNGKENWFEKSGIYFCEILGWGGGGGRLLARWESRGPMDGHFSEKTNMNNCIQRFS